MKLLPQIVDDFDKRADVPLQLYPHNWVESRLFGLFVVH